MNNRMLKWINENKQWLFSGAGVAVIMALLAFGRSFWLHESNVVSDESRLTPKHSAADDSSFHSVEPLGDLLVLSRGSPIPLQFSNLLPGLRLSQIKSLRPDLKISGSHPLIRPRKGAFSQLTFFVSDGEIDPVIEWITYYVRDDEWRARLKRELIVALSEFPVTPELLGENLKWESAAGYYVHLSGQYYTVSVVHSAVNE